MDPLYQEHILDHYKHPRNRERMEDADVREKGRNLSCGDDIVIYLKWDNERKALARMTFEGLGCAISQSGASMLSERVAGMTKDEILRLTKADMDALYGTVIGPSREKCALLALSTLQEAAAKLPGA